MSRQTLKLPPKPASNKISTRKPIRGGGLSRSPRPASPDSAIAGAKSSFAKSPSAKAPFAKTAAAKASFAKGSFAKTPFAKASSARASFAAAPSAKPSFAKAPFAKAPFSKERGNASSARPDRGQSDGLKRAPRPPIGRDAARTPAGGRPARAARPEPSLPPAAAATTPATADTSAASPPAPSRATAAIPVWPGVSNTQPPRPRAGKPSAEGPRAFREASTAPKAPPRGPRAAPPRAPAPRAPYPPKIAAPQAPVSTDTATPEAPIPPAAPTFARAGLPEQPRLSKRMSELGLCSRREADEWIENGWVRVDGVVADTLGTRVSPKAKIEVDPRAKQHQAESVTILINKPIGYVSGQAEDGYEPAVVLVRAEHRWDEDGSNKEFKPGHLRGLAPAGRLDIDSTGLLVLTQDGRIARRLIGDDSEVEKEYLVRVEGTLAEGDLQRLNHGLSLEGVRLKPAKVSWANEDQLRFVLREGKKRQIRRMCELVGLNVVGLKRVRIGSVVLGKLPVGTWRYLRFDEKF